MVVRESYVKEICELLKLYKFIYDTCGAHGWSSAIGVLTDRINTLIKDMP